MRKARRSISARNLSSARVCSRTTPLVAGAEPSATIQAAVSVPKPDMPRPLAVSTDCLRPGYNGGDGERLTVPAPDQQLTHMACDRCCKICKRGQATHPEHLATD